jgi:hypothetical protein
MTDWPCGFVGAHERVTQNASVISSRHGDLYHRIVFPHVHVIAEARVKGSMSDLFGWWSDYTDGVVDEGGFASVTRKIVSRDRSTILMEDYFSKPLRFVDRITVTLKPPAVIEFTGESRIWKTRGIYTFSQEGDFVRAVSETDIEPVGVWKLVFSLPYVRSRIESGFREDLEGHLKEFEKETGKGVLGAHTQEYGE